MIKRSLHDWHIGNRTLRLGERTVVMGILNITPDSFSDGGNFFDPERAAERAQLMVEQGAGIIDIGGESTRPGAEAVSAEEELRRTIPVIEAVRRQTDIPISIDTMKVAVARKALAAGADIINDVSAGEADPAMLETAAETGAGLILMHMRGTPRTMQQNPQYDHVVREVKDYLNDRVLAAEHAGVEKRRIVLDPGIGFGKTTEHNLSLLHGFPQLADLGLPLLVGASRKRFIGTLTGHTEPEERMAGSLAVAAWSISAGAHILRVHDVIETCDVCTVSDRLFLGDL